MIAKRTVAGAAVLAVLAGAACTARRVDLVNAAGHRTHCTAEGYGWGALGTDAMVDDCVAELEAKGYHRVETAEP
jgi:hypothetical protein